MLVTKRTMPAPPKRNWMVIGSYEPVGAELVIHGRGLRRSWVVAVGHDHRP
jgi:hypothetical protein